MLAAMAAALLPCRRYLLPAQLAVRAVVLAGLAGRDRADPDRDGLRRAARLPPRRVLARALVAVRRSTATRRARCARSRAARSRSRRSRWRGCCGPAPPPAAPPAPGGARARRASSSRRRRRAQAHLALLGDKRLLFHESGAGFLMYGVAAAELGRDGRSGRAARRAPRAGLAVPRARRPARRLRRLLRGRRRGPAGLPRSRPHAAQARRGGARAARRTSRSRAARARGCAQRAAACAREGCRFEVLPATPCRALLARAARGLRRLARAARARARSASRSASSTRPTSRAPRSRVVRRGERIVAFANLWARERARGALDRPDALRRRRAARRDGLPLRRAAALGRSEQGYRWFSLGMAPLSGFEHHRLAPLWNRLGALLFRHGEHFYNFQGLRAFKDKFDPVWEPRYLAAPGGLALPVRADRRRRADLRRRGRRDRALVDRSAFGLRSPSARCARASRCRRAGARQDLARERPVVAVEVVTARGADPLACAASSGARHSVSSSSSP